MDAAFDMSDDEDDDDGRADRRGLLSKGRQNGFRQQEQQFTIGGEDSDEEDSNRIQPNQSDSDRTQSGGGRYDDPLRDERVVGRPEPAPIETGDRMPGSYDFDRDFVSILTYTAGCQQSADIDSIVTVPHSGSLC